MQATGFSWGVIWYIEESQVPVISTDPLVGGEWRNLLMNSYFVYILANENLTLYIGVTNSLARRIYEHKNYLAEGFTKKYGLDKLIYFEETNDINVAIAREK